MQQGGFGPGHGVWAWLWRAGGTAGGQEAIAVTWGRGVHAAWEVCTRNATRESQGAQDVWGCRQPHTEPVLTAGV